MLTAEGLLAELAAKRGSIVSSADCSEAEIAQARACGRFHVNADHMGFVLRPRAEGTRTVTIRNICEKCSKTLHGIAEGERGTCASCWFKDMPKDTKQAMNKLIASAFNGSSEAEKGAAVDDAMAKLRRDEQRG